VEILAPDRGTTQPSDHRLTSRLSRRSVFAMVDVIDSLGCGLSKRSIQPKRLDALDTFAGNFSCLALDREWLLDRITIVVANPRLGAIPLLLSPERGQIEIVVRVQQEVEPALVSRIRVEDVVVITEEDAQPRHLTF